MVSKDERHRLDKENPERPRAVLTKREREYYLGVDVVEPKSQDERTLRQNVRDRLTQAILDISLLAENMEQRDVDRVFRTEIDMGDVVPTNIPTGLLNRGATDLLTLLFRFLTIGGIEAVVERAIYRTVLTSGHYARVEVDVDIQGRESLDDIEDRLDDRGAEDVTLARLKALFEAGRIDEDLFRELRREKEDSLDRRKMRLDEDDE